MCACVRACVRAGASVRACVYIYIYTDGYTTKVSGYVTHGFSNFQSASVRICHVPGLSVTSCHCDNRVELMCFGWSGETRYDRTGLEWFIDVWFVRRSRDVLPARRHTLKYDVTSQCVHSIITNSGVFRGHYCFICFICNLLHHCSMLN